MKTQEFNFYKSIKMVQHSPASNPTTNPLCSVCIANFNGIDILKKCLDSLLEQDCEFEIEIIIHDDASTDNSVEFIQQHYSDIELLISEENCGFCVSNNRMVKIAQGEFILLLNNDAVLHKNALKTLYSASLQCKDAIYGLPQYDAATHKLIDIGSIFDPFLNPIPNKDIYLQDVGMVIGACLWLPRNLWNTLGGFPEWFGSLAEDMYLCCLARLRGYPVKALSESGFDHWVGRSLGGGKVTSNNKLSTTTTRRALSERNKTFVMLICYPMPALLLLFPIHICLLCLEGIILSLLKQDKKLWKDIYWNCLKEVWLRRKVLWTNRHNIQHAKHTSSRSFFKTHILIPHKLAMLLKYGIPEIG